MDKKQTLVGTIKEDLETMGPRFEKKEYEILVGEMTVKCQIGYESVSGDKRELLLSTTQNTVDSVKIFHALHDILNPADDFRVVVRGKLHGGNLYELCREVQDEYESKGFEVENKTRDEGGWLFTLIASLSTIEKEVMSNGAWIEFPLTIESGDVQVAFGYSPMWGPKDTSNVSMDVLGNKKDLENCAEVFEKAIANAGEEDFKTEFKPNYKSLEESHTLPTWLSDEW